MSIRGNSNDIFKGIGFAEIALWQWKVGPLNLSVEGGIVCFDTILLS